MNDAALRAQLVRILDWGDAHVDFDRAIRGVPVALRGRKPKGLPFSLWQLVEHLRLAQRDILDFCRDPSYTEKKWPDEYWPRQAAPPDRAWTRAITAIRDDREVLQGLAQDVGIDLFARIPHGSGQTYLRELLLAADHNAYHVGQIVAVRRLLGCWPES